MKFGKIKFFLAALMLVTAFSGNAAAIKTDNTKTVNAKKVETQKTQKTEATKAEWKKLEITPDLNGDGNKDKVEIEYLENGDKVQMRFTPYIKKASSFEKGKRVEKTVPKEKLGEEFDNITNEIKAVYTKKEAPKNEVKKDDKKPLIPPTKPAETKTTEPEVKKNPGSQVEKNQVPDDLKNGDMSQDKVIKDEKDSTTEVVKSVNNSIKGPYPYIKYYLKERPKNLSFNYKYDKNSPKDMDEFVFIKSSTANIRKEPSNNAAVLKTASYSHKYKTVGKVKGKDGSGEWYEVYFYGKLGYISDSATIKREFDWSDMMHKIEKTNKFVKDALEKNQKIYVLDDYTPLGGGSGSSKDKYGNRENQSERGYLSADFKDFINIPDRSIMSIVEETDKYVKVKIDAYDGKDYYLKKATRKLLKDTGITGEITRFIYIDRSSQDEMVVEKSGNGWNVVTSSFVTTGKDGGGSYATPYGVFLVAYSKPVMQYTGSDNKTVVGDAKNAVRISGGGYMHSIPSLFEPKATRNARKAATAKKIGTYPESHKCVRHYDDQIKFIYDWLGNSTPGNENGYRVPSVPTAVIVK